MSRIKSILEDWKQLVEAVELSDGDRPKLKQLLMEKEASPNRGIRRIRRLLLTTAERSKAGPLSPHITTGSIEAVLVGSLGAHRFERFCRQLAVISKTDYALNFFTGLVAAGARKGLRDRGYALPEEYAWTALTVDETKELEGYSPEVLEAIAMFVIEQAVIVIESLVTRYEEFLDHSSSNPRRIGMQFGGLGQDDLVGKSVCEFLCLENRQAIALPWIADEVTVWSMD